MKLIDKSALVAEIEKRRKKNARNKLNLAAAFEDNYLLSFIDTLEVKVVDLDLENENNSPKITAGIKIRSKTNPDVILSIISNDCHEDEFECSNGSVLSLKQIKKYYEVIT